MALLWLIERRVYATLFVGVPVMLSMLAAQLLNYVSESNAPQLSVEELLSLELEQMANGTFGGTSALGDTPVLLWWTPYSVDANRLRQCGRDSCIVSRDRALLEHPATKAVFFYGTDFTVTDLPERREGQDWSLLHEESPKNNAVFNFEPAMSLFNHTATFRQASDLPLGTLHLQSLQQIVEEKYLLTPEKKRELQSSEGLSPVVYVQSSCDCPNLRDDLAEELSRHVGVDSYGECLNNRDMPERSMRDRGAEQRHKLLSLLAKYKFVLAVENAECEDYVTEKLWNALQVGSVPIYHGAPNVGDAYLPNGNSSAVLVSDFGSVRALAERIRELDSDDVLYKRHLRHKPRYSSGGRPVANSKLTRAASSRKWGVTLKDQLDMGTHVSHFECLVCNRLGERARLKAAGFGQEYPHVASAASHYGCPFPLGAMAGAEEWQEKERSDFWQKDYANAFVKSVLAAERAGRVTQESYRRYLTHARVRGVAAAVGDAGGDPSVLRKYEKELRELIAKENL